MEEQVIISVELDAEGVQKRLSDISNEMARVKYEQQQLQEQTKKGVPVTGEYLKQQAALKQEMQELTRQQKNLTAAVQLSNKTNEDYSDSLDGMRAKLNDMQRAYATLTKAQRESAEGKEFLRAIAEQDKAVKGLEQSIGDARRSVGDYDGAIKRSVPLLGNLSNKADEARGLFEALGKGGSAALTAIALGLKGALVAALKFLATPIGAVIAAVGVAALGLAKAFGKLSEAFAKNDEAGTAWAKLMSSFQPIGDSISRMFDKMASAIGRVADRLADWIGSKNEAVKAAQDLVVAVDNLEEAERQYVIGTAEREKTIAKLRTDAKDREKFTAEERKGFILEAIALEEKQAQETKAKAAEVLRILEETAKKESDTSDATKDKIAQARAELLRAETNYYNRTRELLEQRTTAENEYQAEMKARTQERIDEYWREYEEQKLAMELHAQGLDALANVEEERARIILETEQELARLRKDAESYVEEEEEVDVPSVEDMVRDKFGFDAEALGYYNELIDAGIAKTDALRMTLDELAKENARDVVSEFGKMAKTMSSTFNTISELLNEYGENNKKAAKAAKAFALAGIISDQAASISSTALSIVNAVEGATEAAKFTGPAAPFTLIGYIASMVGAVVAQIASTASAFIQAKQLLSGADAGAFEQGGIVGGTSYTGDNLSARVNSREMILTQSQQARLFEIANTPAVVGGIDYEALAAAMAAQPAPVVVYKELRDFENKVVTYNEIASV